MTTFKKVTTNTFYYTVSTAVQRMTSIFLFPIFSFYFLRKDYGILGMTTYITNILILIGGMELGRSFTRLVYNKIDDEEERRKMIGCYFTSILAGTLIITLIFILAGKGLLKPFLDNIPFNPYILYTIYTLPFLAIYGFYKSYLQASHQGLRYVITDSFYFISNVAFNLIFVIVFKMDAIGIILSTLVSAFLISVYSFIVFFSKMPLRINWSILKSGLNFSLPLWPYALLAILMDSTDKFFLNARYGSSVTGIYYIALSIAVFFSVLKESANSAIQPWFFQNYKKIPDKTINSLINTMLVGMALIAVGVAWFTFEVLRILSSKPEFTQAWLYTPIVVIGYFMALLGHMFNLPTFHSVGKTKYLFLSTLVGTVLSFSLCYFLVPRFATYGSAVSLVLAITGITITQLIIGYKASEFRLNYKKISLITLSLVIINMLPYAPLAYPYLLTLKIILYLSMSIAFIIYLNKTYNIIALVVDRIKSFLNFS